MSDEAPLKFDEGQMWEEGPWELRFNYLCSSDGGGKPCRHSFGLRKAEPRYNSDGQHCNTDETWWKVPRLVVAENEAGHDSTGVCADCISEAVAALRDKAE